MYKSIALCLVALCVASTYGNSISSVRGFISSKVANPFGIVEGVVSCGSAGRITQVRFTDCTRVPCQTIVGQTYTLEIDFVPTFAHEILNLKVTLIRGGEPFVILDAPVEGSTVQPGGEYTLKYNIPISGEFMGFSDLKVEVYDDVTELCAFAAVHVSDP